MNLLDETIEVLKQNEKTIDDVLWVGNTDYKTSWDNFVKVAKDTYYGKKYKGLIVAEDLVVMGKDFWLERNIYTPNSWWEFKSINRWNPKIKTMFKTFVNGDEVASSYTYLAGYRLNNMNGLKRLKK